MENLRIRKLTPKECFRLMGFDDSDFEKAEKVNSNTQLYKQAGNSIVVPVVEHIISALFDCGALVKEKEKEEMELKIKQPTFPAVIEFNFEELKQEITNRVAMYSNMVYTEDQVKQAKADRANLRKFVDALSAERIKVKKQCLQPYEAFEAKVNELAKIVQEPIALIDEQVKGYEEKQKQEKLAEIQEYWDDCEKDDWLRFEQIFDSKWLNASVSLKAVKEAIWQRLNTIDNDLETLSNLPEFGFEAVEVYKTTLDMNKAISEAKRMSEIAKAKAEREAYEQARLAAEAEAKKQEETVVGTVTATTNIEGQTVPVAEVPVKMPLKQWVSFRACMTVTEAQELRQFFEARNIQFEAN